MGNAPLVLVAWMLAAMLAIGGALAWRWSLWSVALLGLSLLTLAFLMTQKTWSRARTLEKKILVSFGELQQMLGGDESRSSFFPTSETMASELRHIVEQVKKRMAHLEEDREKIAAIVENLVEGVVAFDSRSQVLFSNSSARRILGLDNHQLQGRSVWEVIRNKELVDLVEQCRELNLHEWQRLEVDIHSPTRMTVEVYGLPFPLGNKEKGSVMVLHDVTQLRHLEQVRAEFIDNVSHEIRTPLAAIIGYLETLIDEPSLETPNNRKFVQVAHQHAERLNRLVDDLRSLSEIESGKVVVRCETVGLKNIVDEVSEMFQPQVQKKHLYLHNQIDKEIAVWVDRDRMVQILLNLVDNAIKYSSEEGSISFQIKRLDETIALQVKDSGQGIPSTDLPRVTERFYRVDRARSREEGGTGLGLSIVKHLVQLLGGQLFIKSELGKGTTVELILPVSLPEKFATEKRS